MEANGCIGTVEVMAQLTTNGQHGNPGITPPEKLIGEIHMHEQIRRDASVPVTDPVQGLSSLTCNASTEDGNRDDPMTYYCDYPHAHAGPHHYIP